MNRVRRNVLAASWVIGACAIIAMPITSADAQQASTVQVRSTSPARAAAPATPSIEQYSVDPFAPPGPSADQQQRVPLLKIGNLQVQVWSPVPEPYDVHANRNFAADPTWGTTVALNQPPY